MRIALIVGIIVILALIVLVIALLAANARLRRALTERDDLIEGLERPELWLPRKEREERARKLLKREDDEYQQALVERIMSGNQPNITPPEGTK